MSTQTTLLAPFRIEKIALSLCIPQVVFLLPKYAYMDLFTPYATTSLHNLHRVLFLSQLVECQQQFPFHGEDDLCNSRHRSHSMHRLKYNM